MGEDKKRTMDGDGAAYGSIKKTKTTGAFTLKEESSKGDEDISNGDGEENISKGDEDAEESGEEESSKGDEEKIEEDMD